MILVAQDHTPDLKYRNLQKKLHLLVALTWVGCGYIAVLATPTWLTMANGPKSGVWLTDSMQAVYLPTWLAARHHTGLHLGLGEVL